MASVNKVILIGNLGKDPEIKDVNGNKVCNFSLATSEKYKDKNNDLQQNTEWHNIVVWGKQAENTAKYLSKGSTAYIEGTIKYKSYEKDGETKVFTEIKAFNVTFMNDASGGKTNVNKNPDDDLPF